MKDLLSDLFLFDFVLFHVICFIQCVSVAKNPPPLMYFSLYIHSPGQAIRLNHCVVSSSIVTLSFSSLSSLARVCLCSALGISILTGHWRAALMREMLECLLPSECCLIHYVSGRTLHMLVLYLNNLLCLVLSHFSNRFCKCVSVTVSSYTFFIFSFFAWLWNNT